MVGLKNLHFKHFQGVFMIKNGKQTLVHVSIKRYVAIEAGNNAKT